MAINVVIAGGLFFYRSFFFNDNGLLAIVKPALRAGMVVKAILENRASATLRRDGAHVRPSQCRWGQVIVGAALACPLIGMSSLRQWHG